MFSSTQAGLKDKKIAFYFHSSRIEINVLFEVFAVETDTNKRHWTAMKTVNVKRAECEQDKRAAELSKIVANTFTWLTSSLRCSVPWRSGLRHTRFRPHRYNPLNINSIFTIFTSDVHIHRRADCNFLKQNKLFFGLHLEFNCYFIVLALDLRETEDRLNGGDAHIPCCWPETH